MKKIILVLFIILTPFLVSAQDGSTTDTETRLVITTDSLEVPSAPFMGEKFIRYMHKPDKRRFNEDPGPMLYYVLEVSTDVMDGGIRRAMPFTSIVRDGEEYFVAFEVVTSFETEEEVLKYAEENGITDIDLKGYIDVPEDEPTDIPEKPGKD